MLLLLVYIILLSIAFETLTLALRLIFHFKSPNIQKKIHSPRIHHSYVGAGLLLSYFLWSPWVWIFTAAIALIVSDAIHHFFFLTFLKKYKYDIGMSHHEQIHRFAHKLIAIFMILAGLIALATPFTPGSWLLPIGLIILVGKRKTGNFLRYLMGERIYKITKVEKILKAAGTKLNSHHAG